MSSQKESRDPFFNVSEIACAPEAIIMAMVSKSFDSALKQLLDIEKNIGILNTLSTSDEGTLSIEDEKSLSRIKMLKLEFKKLLGEEIRLYMTDPEKWFIKNHQDGFGDLPLIDVSLGIGAEIMLNGNINKNKINKKGGFTQYLS